MGKVPAILTPVERTGPPRRLAVGGALVERTVDSKSGEVVKEGRLLTDPETPMLRFASERVYQIG